VILRRRRFHDLVERQLDLFESETDLLDEATEADSAWTNAEADESEELYGDYQLVVDAIGEQLYGIRERYAASLEDDTAAEYRVAFTKAARRRFRRYAQLLEEEG
jgi:hypothetical protein